MNFNFKLGDLIDYRTFFNSKSGATIVSKNMIKLADGTMQAYVGLGIKTGDTWEVYNSFNIDRANLRKLRNASDFHFVTIGAPKVNFTSNDKLFSYSHTEELNASNFKYCLTRIVYHTMMSTQKWDIQITDVNHELSLTDLILKIQDNDYFYDEDKNYLLPGTYILKMLISDTSEEVISSPEIVFSIN